MPFSPILNFNSSSCIYRDSRTFALSGTLYQHLNTIAISMRSSKGKIQFWKTSGLLFINIKCIPGVPVYIRCVMLCAIGLMHFVIKTRTTRMNNVVNRWMNTHNYTWVFFFSLFAGCGWAAYIYFMRSVSWAQKSHIYFNSLNYTAVCFDVFIFDLLQWHSKVENSWFSIIVLMPALFFFTVMWIYWCLNYNYRRRKIQIKLLLIFFFFAFLHMSARGLYQSKHQNEFSDK